MIHPRFTPLILRHALRHRTRTLLTVGGVAIAMFLFVAVQAMQQGVARATQVTAADTTLVVYRENRFCPATSRLPEYYADRIARLPGVREVAPLQIVVNNCRASLDVITYRGVRPEHLPQLSRSWTVIDGSLSEWDRRSDAAVIGERLALRRGFRVGQSFDSSGVTVTVAAIIRSDQPQDQNVAYVHLEFLQQAAGHGLGVVTQFNVRVEDPARLNSIAAAIDEQFRAESEPTQTRPEKAFVAQAGGDIVEIVRFTRYLGWGCLAAVLGLVANAIVLTMRERITEHAVLQTLGFRPGLIARLIISEGLLVSLAGGVLGAGGALLAVRYGNFSLSTEGASINIVGTWETVLVGIGVAAAVGALAGLVPAIRAGRREISHCFRAV